MLTVDDDVKIRLAHRDGMTIRWGGSILRADFDASSGTVLRADYQEECRAWTRLPILRTTAALLVIMTLLRWLQFALDAETVAWWSPPPWRPHKQQPTILDGERLLRRHREEFQQFLSE